MEHKGDTCNRYGDGLLDCFHMRFLLFEVVLSPVTFAGRDRGVLPVVWQVLAGAVNGQGGQGFSTEIATAST
jgi:hypothetical protein